MSMDNYPAGVSFARSGSQTLSYHCNNCDEHVDIQAWVEPWGTELVDPTCPICGEDIPDDVDLDPVDWEEARWADHPDV